MPETAAARSRKPLPARNCARSAIGRAAWWAALLGIVWLLPFGLAHARLEPVRVQLKWSHQFQFAGYYVALEQGFYRDAGFEVELLELQRGTSPIDQLIGGRVDFAVSDAGVLLYRSTGVPLVALAAIFQESPSVLLTLADSGIHTLEDLRDKRIMLFGGYQNAEVMSMLETVGIGPDDFTLQQPEINVRALIEGRTDAYNAYITNEPFALQREGLEYRIFRPLEHDIDFYGDVLITTEGFIARDPDGVRRFLNATLAGWRHAIAHPEKAIDLIMAHYNTRNHSREHLSFEAREVIKLILPNVVPVGFLNPERWERIADVFRAQGQLPQPVDLERFLYHPQQDTGLFEVLRQHALAVTLVLSAAVGLALLTHALRLRALVRARTRELERARLNAEQDARTDELTSLPNRRCFIEAVQRDIARAVRQGTSLTLVSLDIDHFKLINDTYGHAAGDEVLRQVADTLAHHVRSGDIAARIGGEEFALACANIGMDETLALAERVRCAIEALEPEHEQHRIHVTVSMGLALHVKGDDVSQWMRKADLALYNAKREGRNQICVWHPDTRPPDCG